MPEEDHENGDASGGMNFARFCSAANGWDKLALASVLVDEGLTATSPDGGCEWACAAVLMVHGFR